MQAEVRMALKTQLRRTLGPCVRFDVGLARYTSFRIGGPADIFVEPNTLEELQELMHLVTEYGVPCFLLGGGTNVLVSDKGIRGVVIRLGQQIRPTVFVLMQRVLERWPDRRATVFDARFTDQIVASPLPVRLDKGKKRERVQHLLSTGGHVPSLRRRLNSHA